MQSQRATNSSVKHIHQEWPLQSQVWSVYTLVGKSSIYEQQYPSISDYLRLHVLNQVKTLDELGVTHILSALKISTSESKLDWSKYEHKTIEVDDVEDENLLVSFEETGAWIEKVLQDGGVVYVHW